MSILDLTTENISDTPDPIVIEADTEAELKIVDVKMDTDKNNDPYIMPRFEVVGEPLAKDFTKFFSIPNPRQTEKKRLSSRNALKKFGMAFDIDFDAKIDLEDLKGLTGWAILGVSEDEQYGEQNYIKRFITGEED